MDIGRSEGLALSWRDENEVQILHYLKNHIHVEVKEMMERSWPFTEIYGELETHKRGETWDLLRN